MATRVKVTSDGSGDYKIFFDDANPSVQYRVNEGTAEKTISNDGGATWTRDATQVGDTPGGFGQFIEHFATTGGPGGFGIGQTGPDAALTLLKHAPALLAGPALMGGFGDTGAFGFGGGGSVTIPGSEFNPDTVYGGADKMGMESGLLAAILPSLLQVGGGIGESLLAPQPQHFTSFAGTDNDPGKLLSEAGGNLRDVFSQIAPKLLAPPDMSHSYVQDLPVAGRPNRATWEGGANGPTRLAPPATPAAAPAASPVPTSSAPNLLDGLLTTLRGGAGASSGPAATSTPTRLTYTPPTAAPAPGTGGAQNPRTMGAVQLLMHLANPQQAAA